MSPSKAVSHYETLQIVSLTMLERIPLNHIINNIGAEEIQLFGANQLNLFESRPDTTE